MKASLNCIFLGMTAFSDSFTVSLYEKNNTENGEVVFDDLKIGHIKFLICREKDIKINNYNDLNLWKADFAYGYKLKILTEEQICNDSELLVPIIHFKEYFPDQDVINKSLIFVQVPVTELERKRKNTEVETTSRKRREWAVNSTINNEVRGSVYFVDPTEASGPLLNMIKKGVFVALYGARASGKSTRVDQAMIELESEGYVCIYISFEGVNMDTKDIFWSSIGTKLAINAPKYFKLNEVKSADDFMLKFRKNDWKSDVVLFIDECDTLIEANDGIRSSFLGAIRNIKNSKRNYAIWSSVAIGPLMESLYKDYEDDDKLTIVPEVIKDIYERTNGHAGLVCLCGKAIKNNLEKKLDERRCLDFTLWSSFVASSQLMDRMIMYNTFRNMVCDLLKPDAKDALDLLRSVFLGLFDFVQIYDEEERRLADYLTAKGVLMRENENKFSYRMSSIFVDGLIRQRVIPVLYKSRPTVKVPKTSDGFLKILDVLIEAVRCFDKTIIRNAFYRSFKTALVKVDGCRNVKVPRESVYDTELIRILVNWIVKDNNFEVNGQCHLIDHAGNDEKDKHYFSDIIIVTSKQKVVLELLASATKNELNEHFERVLHYAETLSASDIWIVNFSREDDAAKKPHWPPNDGNFESVNVAHFFHDQKFENVRMSARYISSPGTFSYITDQVIQLQ
ncbi:hypothetical protein RhiirC2_788143 [Rhizophagus irregularis]|uniref:Uncharacterized protein n=1 Tax=Rhizophagus irregularis TaxID=588596 RepID=A0A2N1MQR2_9GLOM|nr:hypothetical protein RhiirC2_788143 [Rhizophagus irregularis]